MTIMTKQNQTSDKSRIFFSYGHTEISIVDRIRESLTSLNYSVWMDTAIEHGAYWRQSITREIIRSDKTIGFLSNWALRDRSVCLDELSIAVGVSYAAVITVLLEPRQQVNIPATLSEKQWLDMSGWKEKQEQGEDVFEDWYQGKIGDLIRLLESPETRQLEGQITTLRKKLMPSLTSTKVRNLLGQSFIGREWLREELDECLSADNRIIMITGAPGIGKSAFAVHYNHYHPQAVAAIFCEWNNQLFGDERTIIRTIAFQMAVRMPDYGDILLSILEDNPNYMELDAVTLFDLLLAQPLPIDGERAQMFILIDGLDETEKENLNSLSKIIAERGKYLPDWLHFVITTREEAQVLGRFPDVCTISMNDKQDKNMSDIHEYFQTMLRSEWKDEPDFDESVTALTGASDGNFLYAAMMVNWITADHLKAQDYGVFPKGLSGIYVQYFDRKFRDIDDYIENARDPLGMLAASSAPVPVETLCRGLNWDSTDWKDFADRRLSVFLKVENGSLVKLFHKSLGDWLLSEDNRLYGVTRERGIRLLARSCYKACCRDIDKLPVYETENLLSLLDEAGMIEEYNAVRLDRKFGWRLFSAAGEYQKKEQFLLCREAYRSALDVFNFIFEHTQSEEAKADLAQVYTKRAKALSAMGEMADAVKDLTRAAELAEETENWNLLVNTYYSLAYNYAGLARYDIALDYNKKSMDVIEQHDISEVHLLIYAYNTYAYTYGGINRHQEALTYRKKVMSILEEAGKTGDSDYANMCLNIANTYRFLGEYRKALELDETTLRLRTKIYGEDSLEYAKACNNYAYTLCKLERYSESRDYFLKALAIRKKKLSSGSAFVGQSYNNLGIALCGTGEFEEALSCLRKGLEIREAVRPQNKEHIAYSCQALGELFGKTGNTEEALNYLNRGINLLEELPILNRQRSAEIFMIESEIRLKNGEYGRALECANRAAVFQDEINMPEEHPDRLRVNRMCFDLIKVNKNEI